MWVYSDLNYYTIFPRGTSMDTCSVPYHSPWVLLQNERWEREGIEGGSLCCTGRPTYACGEPASLKSYPPTVYDSSFSPPF